MDRNTKIAFGIVAGVLVAQTYKIRELISAKDTLVECVDHLIDESYQVTVDGIFEEIVEPLED